MINSQSYRIKLDRREIEDNGKLKLQAKSLISLIGSRLAKRLSVILEWESNQTEAAAMSCDYTQDNELIRHFIHE